MPIKVDSLTQHGVPHAATAAIQPWPRHLSAVEIPPTPTPTATSSAEPDRASLENHLWLQVEHHRRASYTPFLAPLADEEETGEEERQPDPRRRPRITFGKLRTADTTAVKQVIWPHELVFTPDGHPATYQNLSFMALVNGYLSIMA